MTLQKLPSLSLALAPLTFQLRNRFHCGPGIALSLKFRFRVGAVVFVEFLSLVLLEPLFLTSVEPLVVVLVEPLFLVSVEPLVVVPDEPAFFLV